MPNGSGGKRVLITADAARRALTSLISMGVNVAPDLAGHKPTNKIGVITAARIEGNAIIVEGVLWPTDHPDATTRIAAAEASLGFSFETLVSGVEDMRSDPLIVTGCTFTGAALIRQSHAAYRSSTITLSPKTKENPIPNDMRLAASAASHSRLTRLLASAGMTPSDRGSLTEQQLDSLCAGKGISERIQIKNEVVASGMWPRTLAAFTSMPRMV